MNRNCYGTQYWLCEAGIIIDKLLDSAIWTQCRQLWVLQTLRGPSLGVVQYYAIYLQEFMVSEKNPLGPLEGTTLKYTKTLFPS